MTTSQTLETSDAEERKTLLRALDRAAADHAHLVAVLWTWLESNLLRLGSLRRKPPELRRTALKMAPFAGWDAHERALIDKAPLEGAALLLARIQAQLETQEAESFVSSTAGIDDTPVYVIWKRSTLVQRVDQRGSPPTAQQHPSITTLAPRLTVCPVEHGRIRLSVLRPKTRGWRAACAQLERGIAPDTAPAAPDEPREQEGAQERAPHAGPSLAIHLDAVGDAGLTGWKSDEEHPYGRFDEQHIDASDEEACISAVEAAVAAAAGAPTLLLLPELTATSRIEQAISSAVREHSDPSKRSMAPALTIVGLYHRPVPEGDPPAVAEDLLGASSLAEHVNEAVVIGPDGREVWRHRKLSSAHTLRAKPRDGDDLALLEDILPGQEITLVESPIGTIVVAICLDVFIDHGRRRLETSGADILLVPSLSPRVLRHRTALKQIVQTLWAAAFVCNRAPVPSADGTSNWREEWNSSFWVGPRMEPHVPEESDGRPSFVFRMQDHVG